MDRRDTVGAMGAHDSKVGHSDLTLWALFYETYLLNAVLISGKAFPGLVNQAAINFVYYLQVAGQHPFKPNDRPLFKRLWQQRVIGIGEGPLSKIPGLIPTEMRLIEQNPHQLRHRHCRVRVIELNSNLVRECAPVRVSLAEAADKVRQ